MTPLSSRQHDAFDNSAKAACREGNLRVLREAAYLLWMTQSRLQAFGVVDPINSLSRAG